ncbi:site-specific DNA-methyltransferase (adenine-specific) [Sporomusaceae bacterium BoRhaA]|uniref:DNA-methyltransferase n=1 Tax=Pelorhabdus rhamnosifermentans TaxID=2772457 RepID=UPI001C06103B|nr:site-specific DNA-methyltransferase [Pelorhabdus rhamnosifermentans]MBU2702911.1 site-specific DNA-methyltransferase (adenine-specific) [Pelorhabdus rhamnosifermentans]
MNQYLNKIIQGDSLEILRQLPSNFVDAVITDPPYSSGGMTLSQKNQDPIKKYEQTNNKIVHRATFFGDNKDTRSWLHWCILWISEWHRILKPGGYFLMFSDWRQLPTATDALQMGELAWRGIVAWDKTEGSRAPHKGYFRHQCEYIVWGTKGGCPKAVHGGPWPGCYRFPIKQSDKFHLTGKPTPLMEKLVSIVPEGSIILDPFAGSGTTLVAAKNTGRQFIGIEKGKEYAAVAETRLSA